MGMIKGGSRVFHRRACLLFAQERHSADSARLEDGRIVKMGNFHRDVRKCGGKARRLPMGKHHSVFLRGCMFDRLLSQGLTLAILGLISAGCGGGLYLLFLAWNDVLSAEWPPAGVHVTAALAIIAAVWWLCRHREELADC